VTTNAAALVIPIALFLGWQAARFHRALKDLAGAKDGVKKAKKILGIERKPFLLVAAIVSVLVWWWLHKHGG
jgi:hypothetical protein